MIRIIFVVLSLFIPTVMQVQDRPVMAAIASGHLRTPRGLHVGAPTQYPAAHASVAQRWGIYHDWTPNAPVPSVWSVRGNSHMQAIRDAIVSGDTRLWLIDNEPAWLGVSGQSNSTHADLKAATTEIDNTSIQWACCGVHIDRYSDWRSWHSIYINYYNPPIPDAWHIHVYESSVSQWARRVYDFWWWTAQAGVVRPIMVSETSAYSTSDFATHRAILDYAKIYTQYNYAHSIYWFSGHYGQTGDLLTADGQLTELGEYFDNIR